MGAWLDKFEQLILNYSRRIITIIFIISVFVATISLLESARRYYDSVGISVQDKFSIPKFKVTVNEKPNIINSDKDEATEKKELQENKIEEKHPMPRYKDTISRITEHIYPLYVAFYNWNTSSLANFDEKARNTVVIANNLEPFKKELNSNQMDDVVNGLEEYIKNFSNHYMRQFNINPNIDEIRPRKDEDFEKILVNPYKAFLDEVKINYAKLEKEVAKEQNKVKKNHPKAGRGWLWMYSNHVQQANEGCDFDFLESDFGLSAKEPDIF